MINSKSIKLMYGKASRIKIIRDHEPGMWCYSAKW